MADIAILVAEEYERRIKHPRRAANEDEEEKLSFASSVSFMAKRIDVAAWVKDKLGERSVEVVKWVPRSQVTLAASNGFFSA
uniref:Uncharacterized protein n=1 Tax=Kalanchoe fedtschenkoi TaxID=63787 RepID=A0A7N0T745_KALFE